MSQLDVCSERLADAHKRMRLQQARIEALTAENVKLRDYVTSLQNGGWRLYTYMGGMPMSPSTFNAVEAFGATLEATRLTGDGS